MYEKIKMTKDSMEKSHDVMSNYSTGEKGRNGIKQYPMTKIGTVGVLSSNIS